MLISLPAEEEHSQFNNAVREESTLRQQTISYESDTLLKDFSSPLLRNLHGERDTGIDICSSIGKKKSQMRTLFIVRSTFHSPLDISDFHGSHEYIFSLIIADV